MKFLKRILNYPLTKAIFIVFVLCILILLVVDSFVMPVFAGKWTRLNTVPDVIGMTPEKAVQIIEEAGFTAEWTKEARYSSEIPEGNVLVQHPIASHESKIGRTVFLTKSKGKREVIIPDLRGKSQKQASMVFTRSKLTEGPLIESGHVSIPRGVIIRTVPKALTSVRVGDTVSVVISAGKKFGKILLPDLTDIPLDSAKTELTNLGFKIGKIEKQTATNKLPGNVLSQYPRSGEYLEKGTPIDLIIVN